VLVAIVGATGTGKSDLSITLAQRLGIPAEVVNADAMQLYRGMDIGTAKVPVAERGGIPHHLLDVLDPTEEASVADYQRDARATIEDIESRGAVPILVGGSGLYVSSVIQDFEFPGTDPEVRARLEGELESAGAAELHRRLVALDPVAAGGIGPHNGRRLVRALEVIELTGEPFGAGLPEDRPPWRDALFIGLRTDRERLVERLDARAAAMWEGGLLDEVRGLRPAGFGITARRAIGYAQALAQLDGDLEEADAIAQTASLTRRLARRQVGWFGRPAFHGDGATWLDADDPALVGDALEALQHRAG
jgi:tRNA dimethylallyltransferase